MTKCTVLVIPPGGEPHSYEAEKSPPLSELQRLVGGYIEAVPHWRKYEGARCIAYCDEDGKLKNKPVNRWATLTWYRSCGQHMGDVLVGDVVIIVNERRVRKPKAA